MKYEDMTPEQQAEARDHTHSVLEAFGGDPTRWYTDKSLGKWPPQKPGQYMALAAVKDTRIITREQQRSLRMRVWTVAAWGGQGSGRAATFDNNDAAAMTGILNFLIHERSREEGET